MAARERWSPPSAPHVVGEYERASSLDGEREPQRFVARCGVCGEEWRGECRSGRPREKIAKFAALHLHRP